MNDDYVKFFRFAQWRIERTGEGVLGFVTNHNYLDAPTVRGMRQRPMESFDDIYILDLHENAKKREHAPDGGKDENVFDIQQGVAIGLYVKRADGRSAPVRVRHADLWGLRDMGEDGGKYGWLAGHDVESTRWRESAPRAPLYLFVPRDETLAAEYEAGWRLTDIFPANSVGIVTARDRLAIRWTGEEMQRTAAEFAGFPEEEARIRYDLGRDVHDWKVAWAQEDIRAHRDAPHHGPHRPRHRRTRRPANRTGWCVIEQDADPARTSSRAPLPSRRGLMHDAEPIFPGQAFDSREFAFVDGDDGVPQREGVGGDEHVVTADGLAHALQTGAKRAVRDGGSRVERRDLDSTEQGFDLPGKPPSPGLFRPVAQFRRHSRFRRRNDEINDGCVQCRKAKPPETKRRRYSVRTPRARPTRPGRRPPGPRPR